MFDKEKRAARAEARVDKIEGRAEGKTAKALQNVRARRALIVQKISVYSGSGAIIGDELDKLATQLFYLDHAIESLNTDAGEG